MLSVEPVEDNVSVVVMAGSPLLYFSGQVDSQINLTVQRQAAQQLHHHTSHAEMSFIKQVDKLGCKSHRKNY